MRVPFLEEDSWRLDEKQWIDQSFKVYHILFIQPFHSVGRRGCNIFIMIMPPPWKVDYLYTALVLTSSFFTSYSSKGLSGFSNWLATIMISTMFRTFSDFHYSSTRDLCIHSVLQLEIRTNCCVAWKWTASHSITPLVFLCHTYFWKKAFECNSLIKSSSNQIT